MSSVNLQKLQETLESLKGFEIDTDEDFLKPSFDSSTLIPRYEKARDEYLRRRILLTFLAEVEKPDSSSSLVPPTPEEQQELEDRQREVMGNLVAQVQAIKDAKVELQNKQAHLATKHQALSQMIQEMERSGDSMEDNYDEDLEGEDVDEEAMLEQEQQLISLQQQLAAKKEELRTIQNETRKMSTEIETMESGEDNMNPDHIEELRQENDKLESEVKRFEEAQDFYQKLLAVVEELSGIKILGVDPVDDPNHPEELAFTLEISGRHKVQIGLKSDPQSLEDLRVVNAKLLTSAILQGCQTDGQSPIRLEIPNLDDLVDISKRSPPGENLRFVVREAVARIYTLEARLNALADLKAEKNVVINIGKLSRGNHASYGGQNQEVVCSLNQEQVSAVLCLTPDCPINDNSVYISQLVGLGGWSDENIEKIQEDVNAAGPYALPIDIIRSLRAEIHRRVESGALTLPLTPRLPLKGHGFGK